MKLPFDNEERERVIFKEKLAASEKLFLSKHLEISFICYFNS